MERYKKKSKVIKIILIVSCILALFLLVCSVFFSLININNTKILKGISINEIDISNMTKEEANKAIQSIIEKKVNNNIVIKSGDFETTTTFEKIGASYDITAIINEAFNIGRSGNIFKDNFEMINLILGKRKLDLKVQIDDDKLNQYISELNTDLPNKIIQSTYYIEDNKLVITKGKEGEVIDSEDFEEKLYTALNDLTIENNNIETETKTVQPEEINIDKIFDEVHKDVKNAYYEKTPFKVYTEVVGVSFDKEAAYNILQEPKEEYEIELIYTNPEITVKDLDVDIFRDKISYFTTKYDENNKDRQTNLELAAQKIDGTVLAPGEVFSYNTVVGARTIAAGYKEAKIYSNGKVIDGIGGGICQVSSTLYNAVVFANLEIVERHNHQFLTSYVNVGRDATVAYGSKDLKFKNNRTYPIKIDVKVDNGVAYCTIYGIKEETEYDIDFDTEILSEKEPPIKYEYDKSVPIGKEEIKQGGSRAVSANVYKVVKQEGRIISRTLLSQDNYNALEKIIVKNPD